MKEKTAPTVKVVPYDCNWPNIFQGEAIRLQHALSSYLGEIYHIGSTSILGMPAKPVIDIMLSVDNIDGINFIEEKLIQLDYAPLRRQIIPHVSFFTSRQAAEISFHLHIHERGSPQIKRHVNFRDYLIQHPEPAKEYAALKQKLANAFSHDIYAYVSGKDSLVQAIDNKAKQWSGRKKDFLPPNTGAAFKYWSHEKLTTAMEANLNVHMTHFAQYLKQVELIRVPGFTIVNSGLPDDTFNYVIDADFRSEDADRKITEVTDYFIKKKTPFSWWVSPHDKPDNLSAYLEDKGYENTENNCAMYLDLDALNEEISSLPSLEIIRATDEKTLQDFALVLTNDKKAFKTYFSWVASMLTDDDPIEYYVGYVDGKPVVRGLSCYFAQVAGLHWLSTAPDARKKGYGTVMQQYRLKRAKELGYHVAVLQASHEGYSLYKRLGYNECGSFREFKKRQAI